MRIVLMMIISRLQGAEEEQRVILEMNSADMENNLVNSGLLVF